MKPFLSSEVFWVRLSATQHLEQSHHQSPYHLDHHLEHVLLELLLVLRPEPGQHRLTELGEEDEAVASNFIGQVHNLLLYQVIIGSHNLIFGIIFRFYKLLSL